MLSNNLISWAQKFDPCMDYVYIDRADFIIPWYFCYLFLKFFKFGVLIVVPSIQPVPLPWDKASGAGNYNTITHLGRLNT